MKNKVLALTLLTIFVVSAVTGCSKDKVGDITVGAGESAIYIEDNGKVSYAIGETFDKDYYEEKDLKGIINDEIDEFNESSNASAKVDSFWVKDKLATAIISYSTVDSFMDYIYKYNGVQEKNFFIGSISDAISQEYEIVGEFTKVEKGELTQDTAISSTIKEKKCNIIIVSDNVKIQIENGNIAYISSNCSIKDGIVTVGSDNCTVDDGVQKCAYIVYEQE